MTWTKKHDEFSNACELRPSSSLLIRWILRRAKLNEIYELEIDLKKFNRWVGKQRTKGEYDRKTIREAFAQVTEETKGMISIDKSYTPWVHKIIVRPLSFILREKSQERGQSPKLTGGNPMYSDEHKKTGIEQQQQNISKLDNLLQKVGLTYDQGALNRIWRMAGKSLDNIAQAIELLLFRHTLKKEAGETMGNPNGYLINILEGGYYKDFDLYYQPDLPYYQTASEIGEFVSNVFRGMKPPAPA